MKAAERDSVSDEVLPNGAAAFRRGLPPADSRGPLPREDRRQVVVDILAEATLDLLFAEQARSWGMHHDAAC